MKRLESYQDNRQRRQKASRVFRALALAFVAYQLITFFIVRSYSLGSSSMAPTLEAKDRVLVLSSAYGLREPFSGARLAFGQPERGDLVLMYEPSQERPGWALRLADTALRFLSAQRLGLIGGKPVIRRVVAVPGDAVKMDAFVVYVRAAQSMHFLTEYEVSGKAYDLSAGGLPEQWGQSLPLSGSFPEIVLSEGQYFVAGDNRPAASDSRFYGPVGLDRFIGRVAMRYWPFTRLAAF